MDISSTMVRVAPDLLKTQPILPFATVKRSAVDWEYIKLSSKSEKKTHFSRWSTILVVILSCRPFPNILKYRDHQWEIWKIRHLLKSLASMWGNSGSQFFQATTEIQSGPDAFGESRFLMTSLTI